MEMIKESYVETEVYYTYDYNLKKEPGAGFSFSCDEEGNVMLNDMTESSYQYVQEHIERFDGPFVRKHVTKYRHGATIKCNCEEVFELTNQYYGACKCPKCGQWYNLFGQYLTDPECWDQTIDF